MNARELIKRHEGLRLKPYKDSVGIWTVGYGHNLEATGEDIPDSITMEQAKKYFEEDFNNAVAACYELPVGFVYLDEVRQAVLIDMCFNLGRAGLAKFINTLKAIKNRDWTQAVIGMNKSKWASQVGKRASDLTYMMATGEWPEGEEL